MKNLVFCFYQDETVNILTKEEFSCQYLNGKNYDKWSENGGETDEVFDTDSLSEFIGHILNAVSDDSIWYVLEQLQAKLRVHGL